MELPQSQSIRIGFRKRPARVNACSRSAATIEAVWFTLVEFITRPNRGIIMAVMMAMTVRVSASSIMVKPDRFLGRKEGLGIGLRYEQEGCRRGVSGQPVGSMTLGGYELGYDR